jgi:hypothetical protein
MEEQLKLLYKIIRGSGVVVGTFLLIIAIFFALRIV